MSFSRLSLVVLLGIVCHTLLWVILPPTVYAEVSKKDLLLFHYDGNIFRECWLENGSFADILQGDLNNLKSNHQEGLAAEKYDFNKNLSRKIRVALHPKIFIKPFILVEELQNALARYQTKKAHEGDQAPPIKEFLAKALTSANQKSAKKPQRTDRSNRGFLLSPYHNRCYGLHLEFQW
jgi:hypothetical protein